MKLTKDFWQSTSLRQLLSLQRKHSTIEIANAVNSHSALSEIFKKFGPHLRTLIISNSTLDDFTFLTILKCSSFLDALALSEVIIKKKLPAINPISIVHLTSVTIHHTNWLVFQFLIKSQVRSLQINSYLNEGEGTRVHLVRMLSNQYRLRELMLYGTSPKTLFRDNDLNGIWNDRNCRLSAFHFGCGFGKNSDTVDSNIVDFLILNNETLRNVEITNPNCEQITAFTLLNLCNVTSLTLDVARFPKDQTFYEQLANTEPNMQLKHLKLSGFFGNSAFVEVILKKYPAITNLELDDWSNTTAKSNTLTFVSENFQQLQQLFVPEISDSAYMVNFNALKELYVSYIRNTKNVINFVQKNRSIEILKVGLVYIEQMESVSEVIDQTQVQHLSFAGGPKILRMIFDFIQTDPPKTLKSLELSLLSSSHGFSDTIKVVTIHFPSNAYDLRAKLDAFFPVRRS